MADQMACILPQNSFTELEIHDVLFCEYTHQLYISFQNLSLAILHMKISPTGVVSFLHKKLNYMSIFSSISDKKLVDHILLPFKITLGDFKS
jgi:hypothetical protein